VDQFSLECFVVLAEQLHFRRAAELCHITQPAMSQQLRRLEDRLGATLVLRNTREVRLTAAGVVFLREARRTLAQMDRTVELARRTDRGEIGQLTVGTTAPCLYVALPEISRLLRERSPGLGLVVQELTTAEQEVALRSGQIDVGLVHPPTEDPALRCTEVAAPPFWAALPEGHALAGRSSTSLAELADEDLVLFPRQIAPQLYDTILTTCRDEGFSPRIAAHAHPAQSIIAMVAGGFGVGLIAAEVQRLTRPGVVYRELSGPVPRLGIAVMTGPGEPDAAAQAFVDAAVAVGRRLH
jgi:DNA-binding transcriptional LysR family regulator